MLLDFDFELTNLKGEPLQPESNAAKLLAAFLAGTSKQENQNNPIDLLKFEGWARKLYETKKLDLDESDTTKLQDFIKGHSYMTPLAAGPMLRVFSQAQTSNKKK